METKLQIFKGDITTLTVDAIVNAANETLLGGGGVDGAIHRAAGNQLREYCMSLETGPRRCKTGQAVITPGFKLKAAYVIHTVGPVWRGGKQREPQLLKDCYLNALKIAAEKGLETIAFPSISTGVFGYPAGLACEVAIEAVKAFMKQNKSLKNIIFVVFSDEAEGLYRKALNILT